MIDAWRGLEFGSLFTGIGGFDLGLERAGMSCAWQVEIDKACQKIEAHHWPGVGRYSDVKEIGKHNLNPVELICGGFPCQDLSIAGRRAGLAGERSGLWFEFHRVLAEMRPQWVVVENVPGLLSSNGGRDFAVILRGLVQLGYGVCWRVLDAQYFGVAQRRRRVFIIGHLGDGRAAEVLFERDGGAWDTPPSREKGKGVAADVIGSLAASGRGTERAGESRGQDPLIAMPLRAGRQYSDMGDGQSNVVAMSINAHPSRRYDAESETFVSVARSTGAGWYTEDDKGSVRAEPGGTTFDLVAYTIQQNDNGNHKRKDRPEGGMYVKETDAALTVGSTDQTVIAINGETTPKFSENTMQSLRAQNEAHQHIAGIFGVRRLTPTECERLQGFPDGWTAGQADGPRYRQLGNAVCVPVIEWIGQRIMEAK